MPIPISIEKLLENNVVESSRIEFKKGWNAEPILHTICAFANDITDIGGGYIVIGVQESNGMPVLPPAGLQADKLDAIQKELLELCHLISPYYAPVCEPRLYRGKSLLVVWCPAGYERPYEAPAAVQRGRSGKGVEKVKYIRRYSNTVKPSKAELKELDEIGGFIPFDDRPNYSSSLNDLELSYMEEFLEKTGSSLLNQGRPGKQELARDLRVLGGTPEAEHPLNIGLLMFSADVERFFPCARIEVVNVPDPTGAGMAERMFTGPIDRQLRDALQHIRNTVLEEIVIKDPERAEATRVSNYPFAAIEEALTNAIYHKSYQTREPVTVRVESRSLSILSLPGPDRSISNEDLAAKKLISARYRNRRIGDFLKELRLVEGRNTGIPTMIRAMRANGSEDPVFETDEDRSFFRVTFECNSHFSSKGKAGGEAAAATPRRRSKKRTRAELHDAIASTLLSSEPLSKREIASRLGYSSVSKTMLEVIGTMEEKGEIVVCNEPGKSSLVQLAQPFEKR